MHSPGWERPWRWFLVSALVAVTLLLSSCGQKGRLPLYSVKGKVLIDGKPAKDAVITFLPKDTSGHDPYVPSGQVNEDGEFTLSTYVSGDGAPAGEYDVTIVWPARYNPISTLWEGDKLKGRYSNRNKPALQVTVEKKAQELPPFELKGSGSEK